MQATNLDAHPRAGAGKAVGYCEQCVLKPILTLVICGQAHGMETGLCEGRQCWQEKIVGEGIGGLAGGVSSGCRACDQKEPSQSHYTND